MKEYNVGILGASGMVGKELLNTLAKRNFPIKNLIPLASKRSAGKSLTFKDQEYTIKEATPEAFQGIDILLSSAGGSVSKALAPHAVEAGCVVIDNTSAFRMQEDVPLVVPEVNAHDLKNHKGLIANPNCSTAQLVVVLKPLHEIASIKRVVVSTYQAVSGAGHSAYEELFSQSKAVLNNEEAVADVLPMQIAFNVIPYIGNFQPNAYTDEELKMTRETHKMLDPNIQLTTTCIRVPVGVGHSEAVNIEFANPLSPQEATEILAKAPLVKVIDNVESKEFPHPLLSEGKDEVFVGRIREDVSHPNGLNLWIVADNLLKGSALNAVQIAEKMIQMELI